MPLFLSILSILNRGKFDSHQYLFDSYQVQIPDLKVQTPDYLTSEKRLSTLLGSRRKAWKKGYRWYLTRISWMMSKEYIGKWFCLSWQSCSFHRAISDSLRSDKVWEMSRAQRSRLPLRGTVCHKHPATFVIVSIINHPEPWDIEKPVKFVSICLLRRSSALSFLIEETEHYVETTNLTHAAKEAIGSWWNKSILSQFVSYFLHQWDFMRSF